MTDEHYYFEQDGDVFRPTPAARGTWDPRIMHGRYISALIAHAIEVQHGDPEFQFARLSVDLFRMPFREPVRVETRVVRDGNRIRVADASISMEEDGSEMARGSVVMLRRTEPPEGEVWAPDIEPMPHPDEIAQQEAGDDHWGARRVPGEPRGLGPQRTWYREPRELIAGIALTPVVRVAMTADLTNVSANGGTNGLNYINADLVVHMVRDPEGEWIGLDPAAHHASDGVAVGECVVHDLAGPLGRASLCGVANTHRR